MDLVSLADELGLYPTFRQSLERFIELTCGPSGLMREVLSRDITRLGHIGYMAGRARDDEVMPLRSVWRAAGAASCT